MMYCAPGGSTVCTPSCITAFCEPVCVSTFQAVLAIISDFVFISLFIRWSAVACRLGRGAGYVVRLSEMTDAYKVWHENLKKNALGF